MTGDPSHFTSLKPYRGGKITFEDNGKGDIIGLGTINIGEGTEVTSVRFMDGLVYNLLSISQICDRGNQVLFTSKNITVTTEGTDRIVMKGLRHGAVYKVYQSFNPMKSVSLATIEEDSDLWHSRLGHANMRLLDKLPSKL